MEGEHVTEAAANIVSEFETQINSRITEWAKNALYTTDPRFVFKREIIASSGVFLVKKRYILHVVDDEGTPVDKFKYTGLEVVRSTTPKQVKKILKSIIETALLTASVTETNKKYREAYDEFLKLEPDEIALRTSANNIDKYAEGASLTSFALKTPSHIKAAIAYNLLLAVHKLDHKLEQIHSGSKIKKLYCKPNKYNLDAIAYQLTLPPEFGLDVDYDRMFANLVTEPINALYSSLKWTLPRIGKEVQTNLWDLFGT
jgi:DNA polymerase elongation subunit (family B)